MNLTALTDHELTEFYQPRAAEFIKMHGREPTGIDSLRHHSDYMMAKGNEADIGDLQVLARLFNLAVDALIADASPGMQVGICSPLIANTLSVLRAVQQQIKKPASE